MDILKRRSFRQSDKMYKSDFLLSLLHRFALIILTETFQNKLNSAGLQIKASTATAGGIYQGILHRRQPSFFYFFNNGYKFRNCLSSVVNGFPLLSCQFCGEMAELLLLLFI